MIILLILVFLALSYSLEVYEWNEGVCKATGEPWQLMSRNWVGGCYRSGERVIVVSWME